MAKTLFLRLIFYPGFLLILSKYYVTACDQKFEGFGVFLGSNTHFGNSKPGTDAKVLQIIYDRLGIRLFRTSYEENFSPQPNQYAINCSDPDPFTCAWINVHKFVATLPQTKIFASIWSPPHYMKSDFYELLPEYETPYLYFIRNITEIIQREYNISIERVSPVNEPENWFAPWDHTNMDPEQLCRIIKAYNDPLISICPENSYFWVSKIYFNYASDDPSLNCTAYCDIQATHAYSLNVDFNSTNSLLAYYDQKVYSNRGTSRPIWMTEVSSTYRDAEANQMQEALDFSTNLINYVSITCVQRYYFWYAYTLGSSGESLIWGDPSGNLYFPKKFFAFQLFVNASNTLHGPVEVTNCNSLPRTESRRRTVRIVENLGCIQFGDEDRVLVNTGFTETRLAQHECKTLCCTTVHEDKTCLETLSGVQKIPARAICHCKLRSPAILHNNIIL